MKVTVNELLKEDLKGKVIIFPTDTVYGIGCLLNDEEAIERIYQIKERDRGKPFAILAASFDELTKLINHPDKIIKIASLYWPGALTLVTKKTNLVSDKVTSSLDTIGIRIPNHPIAFSILSHFGPMVVTSLNISTQPAILRYHDTIPFHSLVDYVVDGGDLGHSASTVYDVEKGIILRQGDLVLDLGKINTI